MASAASSAPARPIKSDAAGNRIRRLSDLLATIVLWLMASSIIFMLVAFIVDLFYLGFHSLSWQFLPVRPARARAAASVPRFIIRSTFSC